MFYVHHHDDQVVLLNAKCQMPVLLNHMRKSFGLTPAAAIDIVPIACEYKNVTPSGIMDKAEGTYANTFIALRAHYALAQVNDDEDGVKEYKVLWVDKNGDHEKMNAALEARTLDEKKKAGGKKPKK